MRRISKYDILYGIARWPMRTAWGKKHALASGMTNGLILAALILVGTMVLIYAIGWLWSGGRVD